MKILIADDQIPDESIPEEKIVQVIGKKYPGAQSGFIEAFVFMRKMVTRLRDAGFDIHVCNEVSQVNHLLGKQSYDISVVDLGWYGDKDVKESERAFKGWEIVDRIQSEHPQLPIIMYSNRFLESVDVAVGAADRKVLPIFKNYDEMSIINLISAIRFIAKTKEKTLSTKINEIDLESYANLSKITILVFAVAVVSLGVGVGLIYSGSITAGTMTSVIGLFSTIMSGLFWKYLSKIRANISYRF